MLTPDLTTVRTLKHLVNEGCLLKDASWCEVANHIKSSQSPSQSPQHSSSESPRELNQVSLNRLYGFQNDAEYEDLIWVC